MSLALEKLLIPAPGLPRTAGLRDREAQLDISVIYTSLDATLPALKEAGKLASPLGAHITLMVPQVIPYPLPLTSPPVLLDWSERRLRVIADESSVETSVRLYLCRDRLDALRNALKPNSIVVIGGRNRWWWPTEEEGIAKALRKAGHEVIFIGRN